MVTFLILQEGFKVCHGPPLGPGTFDLVRVIEIHTLGVHTVETHVSSVIVRSSVVEVG